MLLLCGVECLYKVQSNVICVSSFSAHKENRIHCKQCVRVRVRMLFSLFFPWVYLSLKNYYCYYLIILESVALACFCCFFFLFCLFVFIFVIGGLDFYINNFHLSDFSWRSVIRVRSFLLVYGTISDWSLESFSGCSPPPLNGKVRLPFEFCSSSVIVPTLRKLCWD